MNKEQLKAFLKKYELETQVRKTLTKEPHGYVSYITVQRTRPMITQTTRYISLN